MKRLLTLAAATFLLVGCGGAVVLSPDGTAGAALEQTPGLVEMPINPMPPMDFVEMPELVVDVFGNAYEVQDPLTPQHEERFFYVIPVSLDEAPVLPPPPGPVDGW